MFIKKKCADYGYDIVKNDNHHIGHIAFLKNERKKIIKIDLCQITKDCVPYPDKRKN